MLSALIAIVERFSRMLHDGTVLARSNGLMLCFVLLQTLTAETHPDDYKWVDPGKASLPQCSRSSAIFVLLASKYVAKTQTYVK